MYSHRNLVIGCTLLGGTLCYDALSGSTPAAGAQVPLWILWVLALLLGGVNGYFFALLSTTLDRNFKARQKPLNRLLVGTLGMTLIALITGLVPFFLLFRISLDPESFSFWWPAARESALELGLLFFLGCLLINLIQLTLFAHRQYAVIQVEALQREKEHMEWQYALLKNQLSPHFLFNNLNTLSAWISQKSADETETLIRQFSHTYTYILQTKDRALVSLEEELQLIRAYLFLLQARYGPPLKFEETLPHPLPRVQVPPLALQLLIENAIKHNVLTPHLPLTVQLRLRGDQYVEVLNNKTRPPAKATSYHMGLSNLRQRYAYFTREPLIVEDRPQEFLVALPLIAHE